MKLTAHSRACSALNDEVDDISRTWAVKAVSKSTNQPTERRAWVLEELAANDVLHEGMRVASYETRAALKASST